MIAALSVSALGVSASPTYADGLGADPGSTTIQCGNAGTFADSPLRCEYTSPGVDAFTVPEHVSQVIFHVYGAQGGGVDIYTYPYPPVVGGLGGRTTAVLAVTPGQTFQVDVGQQGGSGQTPTAGDGSANPNRGAGSPGTGGANGDSSGGMGGQPGHDMGTFGGGGGGGASDVRSGSCASTLECGLADRILVAGGGGGSSAHEGYDDDNQPHHAYGGFGGGATGTDGHDGWGGNFLWPGGPGGLGAAGTASAGGSGGRGGTGGGGGTAGTNGSTGGLDGVARGGFGGMGGNAAIWADGWNLVGYAGTGGGGGGGGYHSGGGGGGGGGSGFDSAAGGGGSGGGGSGYLTPGAVSGWMASGVQMGDGKVVVTWMASPTISVPHSDSVAVGRNVTASVSLADGYEPSGTATFELFDATDASCSTPLATLSGTVSGDGATSAAYVPTSVGTFMWTASYEGDINNNQAGPTECGAPGSTVVVTPAVPTLTSRSSAGFPITGTSFSDSATLTSGYVPTGSISFALYDNDTCSGDPVLSAGPVSVNGNGIYSSSGLAAPLPGLYFWVATYGGDANNESSASGCGSDPVNVRQLAAPTFTFDLSSLSKTYGDGPFSVAGAPYLQTNSTGLVTFALGAGSVGCALAPNGTVTVTGAATGAGRCVIVASIAGDANFAAAGPISQDFTIARATPAFTNVAIDSSTFDGEQHAATADVSGVGGEDLGEASVSYELRAGSSPNYTYGTPTTTPPTNLGTYRVTFDYAGSPNYASASDNSHVLTIDRLSQSITFPAIPDKTYGDAPFTPDASADSGLPVVFASSGKCGVSGTTVHLTGAGTCMVLASQPGDATHNPAMSVWRTFTIAKANPTISVTGYDVAYDGASHTATGTARGVYGQALGGLDLSATTHTNPGSYSDAWTFTDTSGDYNNVSGTVHDGIARPVLTIAPDSGQQMVYGSTPPASLAYTLRGFVNGETESALRAAGALSGQASCSAAISGTSAAGSYPITCTVGSLAATNYTFAASTQTVTFAVIAARLTVTADDKSVQYSDPVTLGYTIAGFVNGETLATSGVTGTPGLGTTATLTDGNVVSAPGTYAISVAKGSLASTNYEFALANGSLTVGQEDARATYTGNGLFWASSANSTSATVNLMATVKDISAVSGDPAYDAHPGTISHATVAFVNRDTKATLCTASVALISAPDPKVGTASCTTTLGIGSSGATQYTIGIVVSGRYTDNASSENTVIDVAAPLGSYFITGGGFLTESSSAGQYAADAGSRTNFGFNVKSNKGATNLQGNVNVIFRKSGHTYQIKGNSLTSLGVTPSPCSKPTSTSPCLANFISKANLQDITNPNAPISLGGNMTFQMSMTDYGTPTKDSIGISLYNGSTLLFSSSWSGTRTVEQTLGGGNLAVR